jgi:hypothetical protein
MPSHWLWMIWANGCELWRVMVDQWWWVMVCIAEPVVVNHGVLCWASGCESCCAILSRLHWFSITHHDLQPLAQHYTAWFTTTGPSQHVIIHNHWLISFITNGSAWHTITKTQSAQYNTTWFTTVRFSIAHINSQPLAQHSTPWFTTTASALHTMTHNHSDQYRTAWFTTTSSA